MFEKIKDECEKKGLFVAIALYDFKNDKNESHLFYPGKAIDFDTCSPVATVSLNCVSNELYKYVASLISMESNLIRTRHLVHTTVLDVVSGLMEDEPEIMKETIENIEREIEKVERKILKATQQSTPNVFN